MYGRQGKLVAIPGKRDAFVAILTRAAHIVGQMPGCRLYIVSRDLTDDMTIWVTEIWDHKEAHDASLEDERVRLLIAEARPLMGGPPESIELSVVGGHGLES